jgi:phage terminase small subunit
MATTDLDIGQRNKAISDKMRRFAHEYTIDYNATAAVIRAGYSEKGAGPRGCILLKDKRVQAEIAKIERAALSHLQLDKERIIQELLVIGLLDPISLTNPETGLVEVDRLGKLPPHARRAIAGMKVTQRTELDGTIEQTIELKIADKLQALQLLARHLGMLVDKQEISVDRPRMMLEDLPLQGSVIDVEAKK